VTHRSKVFALVVAIGLIAAACGDSDTPASDTTASSSIAAESEAEATTTTEADPTTTTEAATTTAAAVAEPEADPEPEFPSRIISLSPSSTELLFAIGAGEQVIAVDEFSYYPEEAPVTDLSGFAPNLEAILAFEPDLLVWQGGADDITSGLEGAGVQVVNHLPPADFEGIYAQIADLGTLTGQIDGAANLVAQMRSDIDEIAASAVARDVALTYFHEVGTEYYSATSSTFVGNIYGLAAMVNIADPADEDGSQFGFPLLNEEFIIDSDPDIIFLADTIGYGQTAATVTARPGWEAMSAVVNGRIVELNDDIVSRWGPRVVDFARQVVEAANAYEPIG